MKKIYSILSVISLFLLTNISNAQTSIYWDRSIGGSNNDLAYEMLPTPDGNYLLVGITDSDDDDISVTNGQQDIWVVKLSADSTILWEKTYGGTVNDYSKAMIAADDGGYVIAGSTNSNDGDVSGNNGGRDAWVIKIDADGNLLWQNAMGGDADEILNGIIRTSDGGYLCIGNALSSNDDITGNHGVNDMWVIKLDAFGEIEWQKNYGGTAGDFGFDIMEVADGYVGVGYTYSNNVDVSGHHSDSTTADYWVLKIDFDGDILWQKSLGGDATDFATQIIESTAGNYLIGGNAFSDNGDVSGHYGATTETDIWLVELDADGNIVNDKNFGGTYSDEVYDIKIDLDGGYILAGNSESDDLDVNDHHGSTSSPDVYILKITDSYDFVWSRSYGGINDDLSRSIYPYGENYYIVAAYTKSISGDISYHHGTGPNYDFWILNLTPCLPSIFSDPEDISACEGESILLVADGDVGTYTYDWHFEDTVITTITQELIIDPVFSFYAGEYYIVINGECGSDTSAIAILTVDESVSADISPEGPVDLCAEGSVDLITSLTGAEYTYQWYKDGVVITGAISDFYTVSDAGEYYVVVTLIGSCSNASPTVEVIESITASITIIGSTNICGTGAVDLSATTGAGYNYQWYRDGSEITGATSSIYTATEAGTYSVIISTAFCSVSSADIVIIDEDPVAAITAGGNLDICETGSVALNNTSAGSGYAFQWLFNGTEIPEATGTSLIATDTGYYALEISTVSACIDTSESLHVISSCDAIENINASNNIDIYPNPGNGIFTISINNYDTQETLSMYIMNNAGEIVFEEKNISINTSHKKDIDLEFLPAGIYTIKLENDIITATEKLIIIHK
ncbi:MAG: T9SS type A sorting domain-containing protein [Fimbriimonadaceae bacterium]|nr:T9SS type A sorting domain-containing protein [Chitinophagales bacterium]